MKQRIFNIPIFYTRSLTLKMLHGYILVKFSFYILTIMGKWLPVMRICTICSIHSSVAHNNFRCFPLVCKCYIESLSLSNVDLVQTTAVQLHAVPLFGVSFNFVHLRRFNCVHQTKTNASTAFIWSYFLSVRWFSDLVFQCVAQTLFFNSAIDVNQVVK